MDRIDCIYWDTSNNCGSGQVEELECRGPECECRVPRDEAETP